MPDVNLILALLAGLAAFLSPCILPLIPAFIAYLAGTSVSEAKENKSVRMRIFLNTIAFVIGFSLVFSLIGALLNGVAALLPYSYSLKIWLARIGGVFIILFGLHLTGLIPLPLLDQEFKVQAKKTRFPYLTSFIFGATFAAGWTPCVGPFLGLILTLAISNPIAAFPLLFMFSMGITVPFLLAGIFYSQMAALITRAQKFMQYFKVVSGVVLIILGVLVFTNNLEILANFSFLTDWIKGVQDAK